MHSPGVHYRTSFYHPLAMAGIAPATWDPSESRTGPTPTVHNPELSE